MPDICYACNDNRYELIEKYKRELCEHTNIEMCKDEMAVLDNILFRFWQMDWLDRLEESEKAYLARGGGCDGETDSQ